MVNLLSAAVVVVFAGNAWAQEEVGVEERLAEHESLISDLTTELESLREESEGGLLGDVQIHGFLSQGYMLSDGNNFLTKSSDGSLAMNEAGLNFATDLDGKTHFGLQLFSRDLGPLGNNEVVVDWAVVDYHHTDLLGLRFGKIKMPFGLYNETRDVDMLRTGILLPQSLYMEAARESVTGGWGIGTYGNYLTRSAGSFDYQAQVGLYDVPEDGAITRMVENSGGIDVDRIEPYPFVAGELRWHTPLDGLLLNATMHTVKTDAYGAATAAFPPPPVPPLVSEGDALLSKLRDGQHIALSAEYTYGDLVLAGEYLMSEQDVSLHAVGSSTQLFDSAVEAEGYYMGASYRLSDWFELGGYYSIQYPNKNDRAGSGQVAMGRPDYSAWLKDAALSARFDINDSWVFKLETHCFDGVASLMDVDNSDGYERHWTLLLAKLSFSF